MAKKKRYEAEVELLESDNESGVYTIFATSKKEARKEARKEHRHWLGRRLQVSVYEEVA